MKFEYQSQPSKKERLRAKLRIQRNKTSCYDSVIGRDHDFVCLNCKKIVSGAVFLSGVRNRNHCPYCLHSRHMDLHRPGDRLAACKSKMRPIGLTIKKTLNKYSENSEVMLIHLCTKCGKLSINRIAADDLKERILAVFIQTVELDHETRRQLDRQGIHLLQSCDLEMVTARLLGKIASTPSIS